MPGLAPGMAEARAMAASKWTAQQIPSQAGKTALVTGANSGIGYQAALELARHGAHVLLGCRNAAKGKAALDRLQREAPGASAELVELDMASLASIRAFAAAFAARNIPLDLLINNAGVMALPHRELTADGFERQFGTNHLGHFALTNLLLPRIRDRVVTVSSNGHRTGTIDFDDLNWERKPYKAFPAYAQSKLANLLFTAELQRRLTEAGSPVLATAAHPGMAATNLLGHLENERSPLNRLRTAVTSRLSQGDDDGALPTLYAAVADIPGGSYAGPGGFLQGRGAPKLVSRSRAARDGALARRLWTASEELTGVTFPLTATKASAGTPR